MEIIDLVLLIFNQVIFTLILGSLILPLPLSDNGTVRYRSLPLMTFTLILINITVFIGWQFADLLIIMEIDDFMLLTQEQIDAVYGYVNKVWMYGYRPDIIAAGESIGAFTAFTSMFMHGDISHLAGNMVFLWAFGRRLEDACGPWRFLLFYLVAGLVAGLGSAILIADGDIPSIGASGAIAGLMGGYLLLFPGARLSCLWLPISSLLYVYHRVRGLNNDDAGKKSYIPIPAFAVVLIFIVYDIIGTFNTAQTGELTGGTNYVAHTTGFLAAITIFLFMRKDLFNRYFAGRSL